MKQTIFKYLKPFRTMIIIVLLLVFIQSMADLYLPNLMSDMINNGISKVEYTLDEEVLLNAVQSGEIDPLILETLKENVENMKDSTDYASLSEEQLAMAKMMLDKGILVSTPVTDTNYILSKGGVMLIIAAGATICTIIATYFSAKIGTGFGRNIREAVYVKVQSFSQSNINKFGAASLITRTNADASTMQMATVMILRMMIGAPIICVGGIIMALSKDVHLSWIIAVIIPILLGFAGIMMVKTMPLFKKLQTKLDNVNKVVREQLSGIKVIRAFDKIDYEKRRFDKSNVEYVDLAIKANRIMALVMPLFFIILHTTQVGIIWFGGKRVDLGEMQVGDLMAFLQYAMQILFSFIMAVMMFVMLPRAIASKERIDEILQETPDINDLVEGVKFKQNLLSPHIEFKNVSFNYPDGEEKVLKNISFTINRGQTTAIVGSTGARQIYNI